jgi:hypothetical protein
LLDFFESGQPLTLAADGQNYVLPPIAIAGWTSRFKKICP